MAAPIAFGQLSYVLMQFVDQVMVSRLSTAALAAVATSEVQRSGGAKRLSARVDTGQRALAEVLRRLGGV